MTPAPIITAENAATTANLGTNDSQATKKETSATQEINPQQLATAPESVLESAPKEIPVKTPSENLTKAISTKSATLTKTPSTKKPMTFSQSLKSCFGGCKQGIANLDDDAEEFIKKLKEIAVQTLPELEIASQSALRILTALLPIITKDLAHEQRKQVEDGVAIAQVAVDNLSAIGNLNSIQHITALIRSNINAIDSINDALIPDDQKELLNKYLDLLDGVAGQIDNDQTFQQMLKNANITSTSPVEFVNSLTGLLGAINELLKAQNLVTASQVDGLTTGLEVATIIMDNLNKSRAEIAANTKPKI